MSRVFYAVASFTCLALMTTPLKADQFCPTMLMFTQVVPGTPSTIRYHYVGLNCPLGVTAMSFDTRMHTVGTGCANCPDPIEGKQAVVPEAPAEAPAETPEATPSEAPAETPEAPVETPEARRILETYALAFDAESAIGYVAPRVNDPGTAPQGRLQPVNPAENVLIVKDYEVTVKRTSGSTHLFRVIALRHEDAGSATWYFAYEVAMDDPDRDSTREPVGAKLENTGATGRFHFVLHKGQRIIAESATDW